MTSKIIDYNASSYPMLGNDSVILLTVLTKRIEGTYKAYAGIVRDNSLNDPNYTTGLEWVKAHGNPVHEEIAKILFFFNGKYAR